jgi:hypothetical protein
MMRRDFVLAGLSLVTLLAACSSGSSGTAPSLGDWGSNQASLTIADTSAKLYVASGNCYIAFADISGRIPGGSFTKSGTFTQLVGYSPGSVQYPATFSGTADASIVSITITVSGLGQSIGPLSVAQGVTKNFPACAVP